MNSNQTGVFNADNTTRELKRGSADYWIVYIDTGEAEFVLGVNICCATSNQAVIIIMGNQDVQIKPSKAFTARMICINDSSSAKLMRRYLSLMNAPNTAINKISLGNQQKYIPTVFEKIQNTDIEDEPQMHNLLEELIIRLYRASPKIQVGTYTSRIELVSNIRQRLEKEYSKDFNLAAIAEEYGISVSYMAHLFKNTTGVSIMRYLLNYRISAAQAYLTQTVIPINEVAKLCGFHDSSNFGRTFKKEVGCTPRQYRQHNHPIELTLEDSSQEINIPSGGI